jgi:hypothetical protein
MVAERSGDAKKYGMIYVTNPKVTVGEEGTLLPSS